MSQQKFLIKQNLKNQNGNSILESMIAVALLGLTIVASTNQSRVLNEHYARQKSLFAYRGVASEIGDIASEMNTIVDSLNKNSLPNMSNCINVSSGVCTNNVVEYFKLYRPGESIPLTGTNTDPVYYSRNGKICTYSDKKQCLFKAYTKIKSKCFNDTTSCNVAHSIIVSYSIEPIKTSRLWGAVNLVPKTIKFDLQIDTRLVPFLSLVTGKISCTGPREVISGLSYSLSPLCKTVLKPLIGPIGDKGPTGPGPGPVGPPG